MTQPATSAPRKPMTDQDVTKWMTIGLLVVAAIITFVYARRLAGPLDNLATSQACSEYGTELSREVVEYERSNRWALTDRSDGYCVFGPVVDLEAEDSGAAVVDPEEEVDLTPIETVQISLADFEQSGLYRAAKAISVVLQLGAVSLVMRIVADPLLDRFVRRRG